jgi:hypothetical protein
VSGATGSGSARGASLRVAAARRSVPLAALLALLIQGAAALYYSPGIHEYEELYNAAHAELVRAGGLQVLIPFQYQYFCGGCSVNAALGAASFEALGGPSVAAWRLVALAWFALGLCGAVYVAGRLAGRRGALTCALLFALAPPAFQELSALAVGNHTEAGAWLALEVALGAAAIAARGARARVAWLVALGVSVGFGVFLVRSLLLGVGVLGLAWWLAGRGALERGLSAPLAAAAVPLGASPMLPVRAFFDRWHFDMMQGDETALSAQAALDSLVSLLHPAQLRGIWGDVELGDMDALGFVAFPAWLLLCAGALAALRARGRDALNGPQRRTWLLLMGALAGWLVMYLASPFRVWMDRATAPFPQQVRYLATAWPLALCLAASGGAALWRGRWRRPALLALVLLGAIGGLTRVRVVRDGTASAAWRRQAPLWCFQQERVRGPLALLEASRAGSPLDLIAFAGGWASTDPGYFLPYLEPGAALPDALPEDPDAAHAWRVGQATGALSLARSQGATDFPGLVVSAANTLDAEEGVKEAALEAAWCHARGEALEAGYTEDPEAALEAISEQVRARRRWVGRSLWSMARGAVAGRACVKGAEGPAPAALTVRLDMSCPGWSEELEPFAYGWGIGASLGDVYGGHLEQLTLTGASEQMLHGLNAGYTWGRALHWLPERTPPLEVVPMGLLR